MASHSITIFHWLICSIAINDNMTICCCNWIREIYLDVCYRCCCKCALADRACLSSYTNTKKIILMYDMHSWRYCLMQYAPMMWQVWGNALTSELLWTHFMWAVILSHQLPLSLSSYTILNVACPSHPCLSVSPCSCSYYLFLVDCLCLRSTSSPSLIDTLSSLSLFSLFLSLFLSVCVYSSLHISFCHFLVSPLTSVYILQSFLCSPPVFHSFLHFSLLHPLYPLTSSLLSVCLYVFLTSFARPALFRTS